MKTTIIIQSIGLAVLFASSVLGQTGDPAKLISIKKCAMCHKKDDKGNQYGKWQSMGHAKAYERLATEEAKAVGAKLGIDNPQTSGKCLKCHSTAYFFTEELQTEEVSVENGVSCQSCHGPGADYKKKSVMESREESIANGMVYPAKEKSCTLCHNDTSPTWKADRYTTASGEKVGFDVEQAYEKVQHERPAK
jgi:Zn finger protein HypA/HybF involved in hydrogenase expression